MTRLACGVRGGATQVQDPLTELPVAYIFTLDCMFTPPIGSNGGPVGNRWIFGVQGGSFEGPRLRGEVLAWGGDWVALRSNLTFRADVRLTLQTDDGAVILMTFRGIGVPEQGHYTVHIVPQFETGDPRYAWLNNVQAVGTSRGPKGDRSISYDIFELL